MMLMENSKPALVMVAEDDENDVFFLRRAVRQAGLSISLITVQNGEEAINYLSGRIPYSDRDRHPLPVLLLLDLKMPLLNGFDVLTWLQGQLELRTMPTIVLSSSELEVDMQRACQLGARDYLVKPQAPEDLVRMVRDIDARWLHQSPAVS